MRTQGKIIKWKDDKGFGFVTPDDGGKDIFIHKRSFIKSSQKPEVGAIVTFEKVSTLEGKTQGIDILFLGQRDPRNNSVIISILLILLSFTFLTTLSYLTYVEILPLPIITIYFGTSIITFTTYRFDKFAAEFNAWRIAEKWLHLLSLIGGWPGALVAQRSLHHKSKKNSFQIVFWITVFFNVIFIAAFSGYQYGYLFNDNSLLLK